MKRANYNLSIHPETIDLITKIFRKLAMSDNKSKAFKYIRSNELRKEYEDN